jgi:hypothetical protein
VLVNDWTDEERFPITSYDVVMAACAAPEATRSAVITPIVFFIFSLLVYEQQRTRRNSISVLYISLFELCQQISHPYSLYQFEIIYKKSAKNALLL